MIAVIMAAGKGSRLGSYTEELPKSLLPLSDSGQTLLDYNLKILQDLNIDKIIIVTGFKSERIEGHTSGNGRVKIVYNPFWNSCNVLGSLYMALPYIQDDFLFLHADTLADMEIWKMLVNEDAKMVLPFERKACGEEEMKIRIDENLNLLEISKLIEPSKAAGEFLGIAKFSKSTVSYFKKVADELFKTSDLNHYMESVVQKAISDDSISIQALDILNNKFVEVDFEEDYMLARDLFGQE